MAQVSRRDFLGQSAAALGGVALGGQVVTAANAAHKHRGATNLYERANDGTKPTAPAVKFLRSHGRSVAESERSNHRRGSASGTG